MLLFLYLSFKYPNGKAAEHLFSKLSWPIEWAVFWPILFWKLAPLAELMLESYLIAKKTGMLDLVGG